MTAIKVAVIVLRLNIVYLLLLKTLFSIKRKQGLKHKIDITKEERDIETRVLVE